MPPKKAKKRMIQVVFTEEAQSEDLVPPSPPQQSVDTTPPVQPTQEVGLKQQMMESLSAPPPQLHSNEPVQEDHKASTEMDEPHILIPAGDALMPIVELQKPVQLQAETKEPTFQVQSSITIPSKPKKKVAESKKTPKKKVTGTDVFGFFQPLTEDLMQQQPNIETKQIREQKSQLNQSLQPARDAAEQEQAPITEQSPIQPIEQSAIENALPNTPTDQQNTIFESVDNQQLDVQGQNQNVEHLQLQQGGESQPENVQRPASQLAAVNEPKQPDVDPVQLDEVKVQLRNPKKKKEDTKKKPVTKKVLQVDIEAVDMDMNNTSQSVNPIQPQLPVPIDQNINTQQKKTPILDLVGTDQNSSAPSAPEQAPSPRELYPEESIPTPKAVSNDINLDIVQKSALEQMVPKAETTTVQTSQPVLESEPGQTQEMKTETPIQEPSSEIMVSAPIESKPKPKGLKTTKLAPTKKPNKKKTEINIDSIDFQYQPEPRQTQLEVSLQLDASRTRQQMELQPTQNKAQTPKVPLLQQATSLLPLEQDAKTEALETKDQLITEPQSGSQAVKQPQQESNDTLVGGEGAPVKKIQQPVAPKLEEQDLSEPQVIQFSHTVNKKKKADKDKDTKKQKKPLPKVVVNEREVEIKPAPQLLIQAEINQEQTSNVTPVAEKQRTYQVQPTEDTPRPQSSIATGKDIETSQNDLLDVVSENTPDRHNLSLEKVALKKQDFSPKVSLKSSQPNVDSLAFQTLVSKVNFKHLQQDSRIILRQTTCMLRQDITSRMIQRPIKRAAFQSDEKVDKYIEENIRLKRQLQLTHRTTDNL